MSYPNIVLAIESAINGGSLSLLQNGVEISHWIGSASVSKAEELLVNIDAMLRAAGISKTEIDMIAVSAGPGSFTGIRIGLATALGLKNGLDIKMSSVSALTAMADEIDKHRILVVAAPTGRNAICIQTFENSGTPSSVSEPQTIAEEAFSEMLSTRADTHFVLHGSLCSQLDSAVSFTDSGVNIARLVGIYCSQRPVVITEPLFISKTF